MEFFFPGAPDETQAEGAYAGVCKFIGLAGPPPRNERIQSFTWVHGDHEHYPAVGGYLDAKMGGERVFAIVALPDSLAICTRNNGVLNGEPIKIPKRDCAEVRKFTA